jgi:hypothetical protein
MAILSTPSVSKTLGWVLSLCVGGCFTDQPDDTRHPIVDSLSVDLGEAIVIRKDGAGGEELRALALRLRGRRAVTTIGVLSGEDEEGQFGRIGDAVMLDDSLVAVLDQQAMNVRVFGLDGAHRYVFGGEGQGPGEFDFPVSLLNLRDALWVVDGAGGIHRFSGSSAGAPAFVDRVALPGFARDACLGRRPVIHVPSFVPGSPGDGVLFALDGEGDVDLAFAWPYRYTDRLVSGRMNRGWVACAGDVVALGFDAQNRLDAYHTGEGHLLWHAHFQDVLLLPVLEGRMPDDGRTSVRVNARGVETFHHLLGVAGVGTRAFVVQYARRRGEDAVAGIDRYTVETYLVDASTGEGLYLGEDTPQILNVAGDHVLFLRTEPYPQVEVAQLGG